MILKNLSFEKLGLSFCFHSSRWPWLCHGPAWIIYLDNVLIRQFGKQSCHQRMKTLNIFTANIKKFGLKFWVKKIKFHHIFTKYGLIKRNQFIVHLRTNVFKLAEKSSRGHEILVIHSVQIQTYVISAEYNKFYLPFNCFVGRKNCDYFTRKKNPQETWIFRRKGFRLLLNSVTSAVCSETAGNILFTGQICDVIVHWT